MSDRITLALAAGAVGAAGVAVFQAGPGITGLPGVRKAFFPRLSGSGRTDHVALTFDDGPDQATTPLFLEALAARQIRATFFLLGSRIAMKPRLAAEIAEAGHELAVHGWDHRYLPLRGPLATYEDLARTVEIITTATGRVPDKFRPPFGVLSTAAILAARRLGLTPVLWGCWGREWMPGATAHSVCETLTEELRGGVTVLLHDSDCTSPAGSAMAALGALPMLLAACDRQALAVGPLAEHGL
ncbi:MAG TPA: polysaccharide deacetylase family protein [Streptosporangiaceae bacterium]|jgi:peptidoglycan-N-acetylglucosamine deacetylase|nr:polysaccharide deacetylase family protein [Streptosporangiaceae bacterium]